MRKIKQRGNIAKRKPGRQQLALGPPNLMESQPFFCEDGNGLFLSNKVNERPAALSAFCPGNACHALRHLVYLPLRDTAQASALLTGQEMRKRGVHGRES